MTTTTKSLFYGAPPLANPYCRYETWSLEQRAAEYWRRWQARAEGVS